MECKKSIFFHFLPFSSFLYFLQFFTLIYSLKNTNSLKIPPKYPQITKYKIKLNYSLILFMISLKFPEIPPKLEFLKMENLQIVIFQNHFLQNSILDWKSNWNFYVFTFVNFRFSKIFFSLHTKNVCGIIKI